MCAKERHSQHGKPDAVGRKSPTGDPRGLEQAAPGGGEVRSSVRNEERSWSEGTLVQGQCRKQREPGDWRESSNPTKGSEAAEGVVCQSEGKSGLPLLRSVRQDLPRRCALVGLELLPRQRRERWS